MSDHPIQGLMQTAMEQITEMVNVNTIVGDAIETGDGDVIMPISRVNFGFAAGGSNFNTERGKEAGKEDNVQLPFGGGSGGGVSISPIAFLVVGKQGVRVVPLDNQTHIVERMIDSAPQVVDRIQGILQNFGARSVTNRTVGPNAGATVATGTVPGSGSAAPSSGGYTGTGAGNGGTIGGGYSGMGNTGNGFTNAAEVQPFTAADNSAAVTSLTGVNAKADND